MFELELNIQTWEILLFGYLVFGLAPTMTLLTGLVVGFLYGRAYLGWAWGLGTAVVSSPAGLVTFMMTARPITDRIDNYSNTWAEWPIFAAPYAGTGLLFSAVAALIIGKRAEGRR